MAKDAPSPSSIFYPPSSFSSLPPPSSGPFRDALPRFTLLLCPCGRDEILLREMIELARPGGVVRDPGAGRVGLELPPPPGRVGRAQAGHPPRVPEQRRGLRCRAADLLDAPPVRAPRRPR